MINYIIKRLLLSIPTIFGVIFIVMLTIELVPGDPVELMLGEHATKEAVENVRTALGLDKPLLTRYFMYLKNLTKGDMGRSIRENRLVSKEISDVWPATLELILGNPGGHALTPNERIRQTAESILELQGGESPKNHAFQEGR